MLFDPVNSSYFITRKSSITDSEVPAAGSISLCFGLELSLDTILLEVQVPCFHGLSRNTSKSASIASVQEDLSIKPMMTGLIFVNE